MRKKIIWRKYLAMSLAAWLLLLPSGCEKKPENGPGPEDSQSSDIVSATLGETIEVKDAAGEVVYQLTVEAVEVAGEATKSMLSDLADDPRAVAVRYTYENVGFRENGGRLSVGAGNFRLAVDGKEAKASGLYISDGAPAAVDVGETDTAEVYFGVGNQMAVIQLAFHSDKYPGNDVVIGGIRLSGGKRSASTEVTYEDADVISFTVAEPETQSKDYYKAELQIGNQGKTTVRQVIYDISYLDENGKEIGWDSRVSNGELKPGDTQAVEISCVGQSNRVVSAEIRTYQYQLTAYDAFGCNYYEVDRASGKISAGIMEGRSVTILEEID